MKNMENTSTKTGYTFVDGMTQITINRKYNNSRYNENKTLTAQWQNNEKDIINLNGGTWEGSKDIQNLLQETMQITKTISVQLKHQMDIQQYFDGNTGNCSTTQITNNNISNETKIKWNILEGDIH